SASAASAVAGSRSFAASSRAKPTSPRAPSCCSTPSTSPASHAAMFERIVRFSLANRGAVLFFTLVVVVAGVHAFRGLTIEAFPDPTDTQVTVITLYDGQPTEEVERQIGLPIERALNGTPGLTRLRNLSLFGLSYVPLKSN